MLILGLLLVLVAVALAVGAVYDGGESATVELLGYDLSTTVAGVFFVGMATTAVLLFGVWLLQASFGRSRRRRQERKEAKARQRESLSRLEQERAELRAENERLAQKLEHEQPASGTGAGASSPDHGRRSDPGATGHRTDLETDRHGGSASNVPGPDARATTPPGSGDDATSSGTGPATRAGADDRHTDEPKHSRDRT